MKSLMKKIFGGNEKELLGHMTLTHPPAPPKEKRSLGEVLRDNKEVIDKERNAYYSKVIKRLIEQSSNSGCGVINLAPPKDRRVCNI